MIIGFRIDPVERLEETTQEIQKLHQLFSSSPIFGVDFTLESEAPSIAQLLQARVEEDTDLIEESEDVHALAAYYAEGTAGEDDSKFEAVQFDATVGLAVEGMQEGVTLESLWRVI